MAVLAYLVCNGKLVPRNELVALIWPDKTPQRGRANLRWALHYLKTLLPGCWEINRRTALFSPAPDVIVDIWEIEAALVAGNQPALEGAVRNAGEELLWGFYVDEAPEFESWLTMEREKQRQLLQAALSWLTGDDKPPISRRRAWALNRRFHLNG